MTKIKKDLIHKAKVKKAYAKIKAQEEEQQPGADGGDSDGRGGGDEAQTMHPTRELMLKDEEMAQAGAASGDAEEPTIDGRRRRTRRPGYYDKQLKKADERRTDAETRAEEVQRRREERERKMAERERYKKMMGKTRDKDGKKKLGRESAIILERVKKMVNDK